MYAYPITFTNADGTKVTGELVTEVTLQTQSWTIIPAPNGIEYSGYPFGTGVPAPTWTATLPNLLNQNTSLSINILTTYVNPTSGVTLALNGTLPTGWSFNTGTNLLTYNGTSVAGPATVSFTVTLTGPNTTSTSNNFSVSGAGGATSDVTAPTVPIGLISGAITQTTATISGIASADPASPGATWSGMKQYNVTVTGAAGSPFTVLAPDTGADVTLTLGDIGTQTSTITQSGSTLTFTTTAVDNPYPTNSALAAAYYQANGTNWTAYCVIPSGFTSTGAYDNLRMEARTTLSTTGLYAAIKCNNLAGSAPNASSEARQTAGSSAANIVTSASLTGPVLLVMTGNSSSVNFYYSTGGNPLVSLGSVAIVLGSQFYIVFGANTSGGGPLTAQQMQQCGFTLDPIWSIGLTGLSANTSYPYSATAQDVAGNISASSVSGSFTTAISSGGSALYMPMTFLQSIGGNFVGNYTSSVWQANAAKFNYVMFQWYPGLEGSMGTPFQTVMSSIKSKASVLGNSNCLTGFYNNDSELYPTLVTEPRTGIWNAVNGNNWWSYLGPGNYPGGAVAQDGSYGTQWVNRSVTTPLGLVGVGANWAVGLLNEEANAVYYYNCCINGTSSAVGNPTNETTANNQVDFMYGDNQFATPRWGGQLLCTNTVYSSTYGSPASQNVPVDTYWQQGYAKRLAKWRSLTSSKPIQHLGNCDWGALGTQMLVDPSIAGKYDGALFEFPMGGLPYCIYTYYPLSNLLLRMQYQEKLWSASNRCAPVFSVQLGPCIGTTFPATQTVANWKATFTGSQATPTSSGGSKVQTGTYWQGARYTLAVALLRSWMHTVCPGYTTAFWMDEYSKGAANVWNWLGPAIDPPMLTPNISQGPQGIFKRRFTNGTVWCNQLGNGAQMITASGHFLTANGFSDPNVNTGAAFTSFTMQDADGLITLP